MKGNIRVFCRVRPLLKNELSADDMEIDGDNEKSHSHIKFLEEDDKVIELTQTSVKFMFGEFFVIINLLYIG